MEPGVDDPEAQDASGLRDEHPRASPITAAAAIGALWGLFGYSVLWEGRPFVVDRRFVTSVPGTLVLLPVRAVLWGIRLAETVAGRAFESSANTWWIGALAALVGAALVSGGVLGARRIARRRRSLRGQHE